MCVRYSPTECAEYGCATKIGTLLYIHSSVLCADLVHVNIRTSIGLALRAIVGVRVATRNVTKVN